MSGAEHAVRRPQRAPASSRTLCGPMSAPLTRTLLLLCCAPALALGACAKSVSTSAFKGEQHDVAQTVANLQSDVTASDQKKICSRDLSSSLVTKLNTVHEVKNGRPVSRAVAGRCQKVVKDQLGEVDNLDLTVESVAVHAAGAARSATAVVSSTFEGKKRRSTLSLTFESGSWKLSGLS